MDKRFQVFVSSTFTDLVEERRAVMQALLELDCIPAGMELFVASDQSSWELIEGVIETCDYYIVIVSARYGSLTEEGISFTEKEYDYAVSLGIPVLGFVHADPGSIPNRDAEQTDEGRKMLAAFVEKVRSKQVKTFHSTGELAAQVGSSLAREMRRRPGLGWVRGDQAMTSETEAEISGLRARVAELELASAKSAANTGHVMAEDELATISQGDDQVQVKVGFLDAELPWQKDWVATAEVMLSWNQIFRAIGPALMNEASETSMKERLGWAAGAALTEAGGWPDGVALPERLEVDADPEALDQVKVQFRALNLIEKGTARRAPSDKSVYWRLTERGEVHLAQLMAIRR